jgi:hypothetical protein
MNTQVELSLQTLVAFARGLSFVGVLCTTMVAQLKPIPTESRPGGYINKSIGFRYTPPSGMRDETEHSRLQIEENAKVAGTGNTLSALLAMSTGLQSEVPTWGSVTIETYPRQAVPDNDDARAEAKMSTWVAGFSDLHAVPKRTILSGQDFAVFVFGIQQGNTKKGAVIWTTIRKGKLLSFAFVANSPEQLTKLTETMKSVQFF